MVKTATAIAVAMTMAGCAATRDHRGSVLDEEMAAAVQVGVDNKESVQQTLGRPTFTGTFDDNDWYYVARETRTFAFRTPRVVDQTVLRVRFDQAGNVVSVERTGPDLVARIDPVNDKTPTLGRKRTLFEDIFGNIGSVGTPATGPQ
ncbi:MAG TPA: outer membrane protein assembly factor BamE [Sphingomicrobium sp.]|nr:outer membrane protein assembly factor BamE [Sphingomicrobium sp.]